MTRYLLAFAIPAFIVGIALAYKRRVGHVPDSNFMRALGMSPGDIRESTAPRLAGLLLVTATLAFGAAIVLYVGGIR